MTETTREERLQEKVEGLYRLTSDLRDSIDERDERLAQRETIIAAMRRRIEKLESAGIQHRMGVSRMVKEFQAASL